MVRGSPRCFQGTPNQWCACSIIAGLLRLMKSRRVKMSLEQYYRLPFSPAWKQEYINGCLVETRRQVIVHATIPVGPRLAPNLAPLRPASDADEKNLLPCFEAAFKAAFEFCDYTKQQFAKSARECLHHFFHGPFHCWLPASRVALGPPESADAGKPIGAALLLQQDEGWALLDMIFVTPAWQRHHLATVLAAAALTGLSELGGYRTLVSRYHLGNEPSRAWHRHFGFTDEPDLHLAQLQLRAAMHELARQQELGTLTPQLERELTQQRDHWQRETDRLEALFDQGRREEADPWRKWRRKIKEVDSQSIEVD